MDMMTAVTYVTATIKRYASVDHVESGIKQIEPLVASGTGFFVFLNYHDNGGVPVVITDKRLIEQDGDVRIEVVKVGKDKIPLDREAFELKTNHTDWITADETIGLSCLPVKKILMPDDPLSINFKIIGPDMVVTEKDMESMSPYGPVLAICRPAGLADAPNHKPIIISGFTATGVKNNYQDRPEFLINIPWYPGMAGAPVFIFLEKPIVEDKKNAEPYRESTSLKIIGVLAGDVSVKQAPKSPPFNLARVIKITALPGLFHRHLAKYAVTKKA